MELRGRIIICQIVLKVKFNNDCNVHGTDNITLIQYDRRRKKEFEEFLLWKKEREKQKEGTLFNASNTDSEEERSQETYDRNIHNEKKKKKNIWCPIVLLCVLIYSGIIIASKIKIPHQSNINPEELGSSSVESTIKDTMQERIVREIKEEAKQKEKLTYIKFTAAYLSKPNSAGGCDAHFSFKNTSKNTIKYLYIQYEVYNAVDDDIVSDRFERDGLELQYTGPLKPGRSDSGIWECIIYDYSAKRLVITGLTIVYMDGMKIQYNSEEVKALIKIKK